MKIGIDARFAIRNRRGIGNYTLNLVEQLAEIDRENEYLLYLDRDDVAGVLPKRPNMRTRRIGPSNYLLWEQVALPKEAKVDGVDVLHCPANTAPMVADPSIGLVMSILDVMFMLSYSEIGRSGSWYQRLGRHYRKFVVPRAARRARRIITISQYSKKDILKHFPFVAEELVHPTLLATSLDRALLAEEIEPSPPIREIIDRGSFVLAMGALDPRKNTEFLIRNFLELRKSGRIGENLVIVGLADWRRTPLFRMVQSSPVPESVLFADYVSQRDLVALYRRAAAFAYPSLYEGFGLPPLEAMTCGAPVITSRLTSIPEIVGDAALLIDPYSDSELRGALVTLLSDRTLRESLVEAGHRQAASFSWRRMARETLEIYRRAAGVAP